MPGVEMPTFSERGPVNFETNSAPQKKKNCSKAVSITLIALAALAALGVLSFIIAASVLAVPILLTGALACALVAIGLVGGLYCNACCFPSVQTVSPYSGLQVMPDATIPRTHLRYKNAGLVGGRQVPGTRQVPGSDQFFPARSPLETPFTKNASRERQGNSHFRVKSSFERVG